MNSKRGAHLGAQEPRVANHPKFAFSHADDAAFLASSYGLAPDEWQFAVLEAWLGERRSGKWVAGRCGLAVPRQNGKNALIEIVELYKMVVLGRRVLHTAHEVKTARKAFIRLCSFFENERKWPELAALVSDVRRTNGQEAIVLTNGASCEFVARSRGSARGYTVDDLVCDEAQELTDEQLEALQPTISAAPSGDPQTTLIGTPPGPNSPGEVFARMRQAGVEGKDRRLSWHEWSVVRPFDVSDRSLWALTNPALGTRLQISVIEDEYAQMSADGFARERLGYWPDDADAQERIIQPQQWQPLATEDPPEDGTLAYGVKFSADGARVALSVALRPDDKATHIELVASKSMVEGTRWLEDWLVERWRKARRIVIDGKSHAGALELALRQRKVSAKRLIRPTVDQVISAHAGFVEAIVAGELSHFGDPAVNYDDMESVDELSASVLAAGKREIGKSGGWGFQSVTGIDVTPAEAAVLAHYGVAVAPVRSDGGSAGRVVVMA